MSTFVKILTDVGEILGVGLLFGAGIPVLFALGVKALSPDPATDGDAMITPNSGHRVLAGICFAVCLGAVAAGMYLIINKGPIGLLYTALIAAGVVLIVRLTGDR